MAEQKAEAPREPEEAPEAQEEAPAPRGPLLPPALVRWLEVCGVLAVLAVGAIFLVTEVIAPRIHAMGSTPAAAAPAQEKKAEPGEVVTVADLVINPAGTGGRRYLKVAAAIEAKDAKAVKELGLRTAQVRDLLIRDLSARTLDELTDPTAKEEMRQTLVDELNEIVGVGQVRHVYFTEYVVQ